MRELIISMAFVAVSFAAAFYPQQAMAEGWSLTLEEAIERAISENRDIEIVRQRLVELAGLRGEAMSQGLPQLTGIGQYQRTWKKPEIEINGQIFAVGAKNTYTAGTEVSQLLWDGGRVFKAVRVAKTEEARGIENVRDAEQVVRYQVKQTFYGILYTDKVIEVLEGQLKQLRGHLSSIQTRFRDGLESDYALMRQEVEVSNIEPDIIDAKRGRELLVNGLKIILAIPVGDEVVLEGKFDYRPDIVPSVEDLVEMAKAGRPDLAAERLREKSLRQNVGIEKAGYWPTLNFNTTYEWQGQTDNWWPDSAGRVDVLITGFNLSWPLFDGLKTYSRVKQAKARFLQQSFATSQLEDSVVREVRDAHQVLIKAREMLASQQKSLAMAKRASSIAGERFRAGLASQLELNDTIEAQAKAEQNYLRAAFDCLSADAALEKMVGGEL